MKKLFTTTLLIVSFICSGTAQSITYFPERNAVWQEKVPTELNVNTTLLADAVAFANSNEYSESRDLRIAILKGFSREPFHEILGPTKERGGPAGMILKNGYIVAKWGDIKRVDMTFSVTKSFLSTVAGLAYDNGLIASTDDKVANYIWDGTFEGEHNSKITWLHLLQQTSDWSGELWGGKDWADRPPREGGIDNWKYRELKEPGTFMEYNDVRVNVLAYSLTHVWRQPVPQVLKERIMDPIGASTTWRWFGYDNAWTVIDGLKMKSVTGGGHSGGGIFISAEDMARFGLLFLNNGKWKEQQLISETWIEKAITPSAPNVNYGYMWWLNKKGSRHWEGLSENIYYAAGFGGNFIVIDKEKNLVVVTRWLEPSKIGEFMSKVDKSIN
jgi:CubicO group peptidase (beta-lactamase class C family)